MFFIKHFTAVFSNDIKLYCRLTPLFKIQTFSQLYIDKEIIHYDRLHRDFSGLHCFWNCTALARFHMLKWIDHQMFKIKHPYFLLLSRVISQTQQDGMKKLSSEVPWPSAFNDSSFFLMYFCLQRLSKPKGKDNREEQGWPSFLSAKKRKADIRQFCLDIHMHIIKFHR